MRPIKAERSSAPDSFASLIGDSVAESASKDRASASRDQPPRRRVDDAAAAETRQPRDSSSTRASPHTRVDDNSGDMRSDRIDASTDVGDASKPDKSADDETSGATPDTKAQNTADIGSATDEAGSSAFAAATVVAVAIPVAVVSAAISAGSAPSVGAQAPLAIAAAALGSSSAINGPQSASASSAGATSDAATTLTAADKAAGLGMGALGNAGKTDAAAVTQPAVTGDAVATTAQQVAATAVASGAAKTRFNAAGATRSGAQENSTGFRSDGDDSETSLQSTDKTATAPRSITDGKSDAADATLAAKPEPSNANAPIQFSGSSHEHTAAIAAGSAQGDLAASGIQAANNFQQPQSTGTAVGQLNVTVAAAAAVPLNALALQIAATAQSGKSRFEIRLDPAELGRIDVRIDIDRLGQMTSHLTVEKPETLAMLRHDAPQLQRALDDAGFKTGDGGLQFSLRDQSSSGQNSGNESARHGQRLIIGSEDTLPATTAGRNYGRMLASSGGVDIRV